MNLQDSILLDKRLTSNFPAASNLTESILLQLDCWQASKHKRNRWKDSLKTILMNLWDAWRDGKCVAISRDSKRYRMPKRYGILYFRYKFFIPLLDELDKRNFIVQKKGFKNRVTNTGFTTRIWASPLLETHFSDLDNDNIEVDHISYADVILLKDTRIITINLLILLFNTAINTK